MRIVDEKLQKKIGFVPHINQQLILNSEARDIVVCAGRRFGKSAIAAYKALKVLLADNKRVAIISPTYDLSQRVFEYTQRWLYKGFPGVDDITTRPFPHIKTPWGSVLECKSAENPVGILGQTYDLVIVDEASRIPRNVWEVYVFPTTSQGGKSLFISCITKDNFVLTDRGFKKVSSFPFKNKAGKEQKYDGLLYGKNGFDRIGYLWENRDMDTIKITVEGGYELEGTLNHPIIAKAKFYRKFGTWIELQDMTKEHFVLLQLNQQVFGNNDLLENNFKRTPKHHDIKIPRKTHKDFAYFIGIILGDGYVGKRDITITNQDREVIEFLRNKPFGLNFSESSAGNNTLHLRAGSDEFVSILDWLGYKKVLAKYKVIPDKCLEWSKENICSLLSGLFDTDGSCSIRKTGRARINYNSTSYEMVRQVQMLLLDLGIISSFRKQIVKPTERVRVSSIIYGIEINQPIAVKRFKEQVGFRIKRKNDNLVYRLKNWQRQYIKTDNGEFCWKRITKIEKSHNRTFDFNIPIGHNFFSNGFISHNTPFGKNYFYERWIDAKENNGAFHFRSIDNPYIKREEWDRAKEKLPEQVFKQEYEAEFLDDAASVFRGIKDIINQNCLEEPKSEGNYLMGVDLGKHEDFTVITVIDRATHKVVYFARFKDIQYPIQKSRIIAISKRYNDAQIVIDSTGLGDPITDDLRHDGRAVEDFRFSNRTKQQLVEKLSLFIEQKEVFIPPEQQLIDELEAFAYNLLDSGKIRYGAPQGLHDDCVISLALAVWLLRTLKESSGSVVIDNREVGRQKEILHLSDVFSYQQDGDWMQF